MASHGLPLEITTDEAHLRAHLNEFYRMPLADSGQQQWVRTVGDADQPCLVSGDMFKELCMRLPWEIIIMDYEPHCDVYELRIGDMKEHRRHGNEN